MLSTAIANAIMQIRHHSSRLKAVVPNLGVAEHFKGGREAVANATAKVNADRTRYRSDCVDESVTFP